MTMKNHFLIISSGIRCEPKLGEHVYSQQPNLYCTWVKVKLAKLSSSFTVWETSMNATITWLIKKINK